MTRRIEKRNAGGDLFVHPGATTFTGKVDKSVSDKLAALPFVRSRKRGEKGERCWWSVNPTGDYAKDYGQGRAWARLILPLLKYNVGAPLLSWIIVDMIKAGERNGLVLGFVREIGDRLKNARCDLLCAVIATDPKAPKDIKKVWRKERPRLAAAMADAA